MYETNKTLKSVYGVWNGAELDAYIQRAQTSFQENERTVQTLKALSELLVQTVENMRNTDQMCMRQIRNIIGFETESDNND